MRGDVVRIKRKSNTSHPGHLVTCLGIAAVSVNPHGQAVLMWVFALVGVISLENRVESQVEEINRLARLKRFLAPAVAELITTRGEEPALTSHRGYISTLFSTCAGSRPSPSRPSRRR